MRRGGSRLKMVYSPLSTEFAVSTAQQSLTSEGARLSAPEGATLRAITVVEALIPRRGCRALEKCCTTTMHLFEIHSGAIEYPTGLRIVRDGDEEMLEGRVD